MKKLMFIFLVVACSTAPKNFSSPQDSSRTTDPKYLADQITSKIELSELDTNLSRFYAGTNTSHISAIPLTGALLDSVGFLKAANEDYNRFEFRKISDSYKAYLFNKVSCFTVFIKDTGKADLKDYDIFIANTGEVEHSALIKSEQKHDSIMTTLNGVFSKTYESGKPRSIQTSSIYSQELVCGNKIEFKKPFYMRFKSKENKDVIDLYWL